MKKLFLIAGFVFACLLTAGAYAPAQTPSSDASASQKDVDALIERIKAARAKDQDQQQTDDQKRKDALTTGGATGETPKVKTDKTADDKKAAEATAKGREKTAEKKQPVITNPQDYIKSQAQPQTTLTVETYGTYPNSDADKLMDRIRSSRASQTSKQKAQQENGGIAGETNPIETKDVTQVAPRRFLMPQPGQLTNVIGGEALAGVQPTAEQTALMARVMGLPQLPDPSKDPEAYQKLMQQQFGVSGQLPTYADMRLLRVYESDRFKDLLADERDVLPNQGQQQNSLNQLYNTYQAFQSVPQTNKVLGQRNTYLANPQDYLSSSYKGSIYATPYNSDPYNRSYWTNTTQTKYGSDQFYDLNTNSAYSDYYQREYGVNNNFVPTSTSRQYDVNTMKQWATDLQTNYGINVRPGDMNYGDMYWLKTGKP